MKFLKTSVASALALLAAPQAFADDNTPVVYGKINVSVQSSDEGGDSYTELKSNASRFGIKGDLKLSDDLEAIYKLEFQVDVTTDDNNNDDEDNIKSRNQYVGLRGSFGEVVVGRNDSMLKQSQGKIDLFNDYEADIKNLWKGENRVNQSVTYKSPKFNDFQVGMTYIAEGDEDGDDGYSLALMYGDKELKKSQFFASIAMDDQVKGYDVMRATVHGKFGDFKVGLGYNDQELSEEAEPGAGTESESGYLFSTSYKVMKNFELKAQYQEMEDDNVMSFGGDYKLGSKTKLFAWYSTFDYDMDEDEDYFAVGMEHKF